MLVVNLDQINVFYADHALFTAFLADFFHLSSDYDVQYVERMPMQGRVYISCEYSQRRGVGGWARGRGGCMCLKRGRGEEEELPQSP